MHSTFTTAALIGLSPTTLAQLKSAPSVHHLSPAQLRTVSFLLNVHALNALVLGRRRPGMTAEHRRKLADRFHRRLARALENHQLHEFAKSAPLSSRRNAVEKRLNLALQFKTAAFLTVTGGAWSTGVFLTLAKLGAMNGSLTPPGLAVAATSVAAIALHIIGKTITRRKRRLHNIQTRLAALHRDHDRHVMDFVALNMVKQRGMAERRDVESYLRLRQKPLPTRQATEVILGAQRTLRELTVA